MALKRKTMFAVLAAAWLATPVLGAPTIVHDPIQVATKGQPLGVRATVRDAAARVESVALFYATSRGMSPFRAAMTSSGAGIWYGTIPGHMIGPGAQLFYYLQAENADGETKETDWQTVKVVEAGVAPAAIPSASAVAQQAQRVAVPVDAGGSAPAPAPAGKAGKSKYMVPISVIAGGAVAIGGAIAIADNNGGGGGGGGGGAVTNGNFGGDYAIYFEPASPSNTTMVSDSGLVNVYVNLNSVEIVGLWGSQVLRTTLNGQVFSISTPVPATGGFPSAHLIVSGEFNGNACTARVDGYSTDPLNPGNLNGRLTTTRR